MENAEIAAMLDEIGDILEIQGKNPFRVRSYRSAARTVRSLSDRLEDRAQRGDDLTELPNIGKGTAEKLEEIFEKGTCRRLEKLRKQVPTELTELLHVPGLGPKKTKLVHEKLGVDSITDLKSAAEAHRLRDLEGLGAKTEQRILEGIQTFENYAGRMRHKDAADIVTTLGRRLDDASSVKQWVVAGSFRRCMETVGDLDVLIEASDEKSVADWLTGLDIVKSVVSHGEDRVSVRLTDGLQVDFRFFKPQAFGSAMFYFTGSRQHNIALRKRAQQKDWKLNEYGLFRGNKRLCGRTEKEVYEKLGLSWIAPELREDRGEIDCAANGDLPRLIELKHIHGDLHAHTKHSDGANTIRQMAKAAIDRGYDYLAITDHSKAVAVTQGLDDDHLKMQADKIREIDQDLDDFWLMAGVEVDILKDGRLDIAEDVLASLDWVNASVHSNFNQSRKQMTDRLLAAVGSGVVDCLAHPFGRLIGKRDPIDFDFDKVLEACLEEDVCLELNAQPERLDLSDIYCQRAKEAGVLIVISTDAHKTADLESMEDGIGMARRGWLEKGNVANTKTRAAMHKWLRGS